MPIDNPYYIPKENKKPVEEVRFWDYETKTSKLSPSARSKIVKKYGGDYVSENKEFYGPGSSQSSYSDNSDEARRARHAGKTVIGMISTVASKAGGPVVSGVAGVAASAIGEIGHALSSGSEAKDTWKYTSELGQDMIKGAGTGMLVGSTIAPVFAGSGCGLVREGWSMWEEFLDKGGWDKSMASYHEYHRAHGENYSSYCDVCKS